MLVPVDRHAQNLPVGGPPGSADCSAVAFAYAHVPHYRETLHRLGLSPDSFRTAADLARLPILDRGQVQLDPERFVSTALPRGR